MNVELVEDVSLSVSGGVVTLYKTSTGVVTQMNPAGSHCLMALLDGEEEMGIVERVAGQLAKPVGVVLTSLRRLVDELVMDGWIERTGSGGCVGLRGWSFVEMSSYDEQG